MTCQRFYQLVLGHHFQQLDQNIRIDHKRTFVCRKYVRKKLSKIFVLVLVLSNKRLTKTSLILEG